MHGRCDLGGPVASANVGFEVQGFAGLVGFPALPGDDDLSGGAAFGAFGGFPDAAPCSGFVGGSVMPGMPGVWTW